MNRKGFTLVELLAVVILLALISLIAVPAFSKYIFNSESKYYNSLEKTVVSAAKEYMSENKMFFPKNVNDYYMVLKDDLLDSGVIDEISDSKGKGCAEARVYVQKEKQGKYQYVAYVECDNFKSSTLEQIDKMINDSSSNSGSNFGDSTPPSDNYVQVIKKTTNSITLSATCIDQESGVREYLFSNDGGVTFTSNGRNSTYTYQNLKINQDYSFVTKCINGANLGSVSEAISAVTANIINPSINQTAEDRRGGAEWAVTKDYTITNSNNDVSRPHYYFKSSSSIKVSDNLVIGNCGNSELPEKCIYSKENILKENMWYETNEQVFNIRYGKPGTLYAAIGDGENISGIVSMIVEKVDEVVPTINAIKNVLTLGKDDYNFLNNISYSFGMSGGNVECSPSNSLKTGSYDVVCTAHGNNGIIIPVTVRAIHSYPATITCQSGGTYKNNSCYFTYTDGDKCGWSTRTYSCYKSYCCDGSGCINCHTEDYKVHGCSKWCESFDTCTDSTPNTCEIIENNRKVYLCPQGGTIGADKTNCYY